MCFLGVYSTAVEMAEEKKPLQADTGAGRVAIEMDDEKCVSLRCLDPDALRRR